MDAITAAVTTDFFHLVRYCMQPIPLTPRDRCDSDGLGGRALLIIDIFCVFTSIIPINVF